MKRFYITLAGLFLMVLAWELGAQKTSFYNTKVGINTNNPTYALQIYQPDISMAAIDITYAAGAGNTRGIQLHNGSGLTNFSIGVDGSMFVGGQIRLGAEGGSQPAMLYITNHGTGPSLQIDGIHGIGQLTLLTNGNVGLGTNEPKALLHLYSPLTANPKLLQFDDDGHVPRAFAGIFPGGGGFSFFNGAGTNDNARTMGWTATSTILNAPTTLEEQIGGAAQWRTTLTAKFPVGDDTELLGDATHRIARIDVGTRGITNAGPMNLINGPLKVGLNGGAITNILVGSATLDFGEVGTVGFHADLSISVPGAAIGDVPFLGVPPASIGPIEGSYQAFASNDTVYVRFVGGDGANNPASGTFSVIVFKKQ